mmetsp:Transcript_31738/g.67612  ORF Transcript_31738/g.67612 Transcript_31738/m.67612 type:complete len:209 (-) Transcript_31738:1778-2404(-)
MLFRRYNIQVNFNHSIVVVSNVHSCFSDESILNRSKIGISGSCICYLFISRSWVCSDGGLISFQFHSWDFCRNIGVRSRFRLFLLDGIIFNKNVMLLFPIIRVVVSITENKSAGCLVTSPPRINLFDNAVRSRDDVKFAPLDNFLCFETEEFACTLVVAGRPKVDGLSCPILHCVCCGRVVVCNTVDTEWSAAMLLPVELPAEHELSR